MRVNLTRADVAALAALLRSAAIPGAGDAGRSSPGTRLGTRAVAARIGYAESTIRSWMARNGPPGNPFPEPGKHLGRCEWDLGAIDEWLERQKSRRAERPEKRARRKPARRTERPTDQ